MKPGEIVERIAEETNVPKGKVKLVVKKAFEILAAEIAAGGKTAVPGLGMFLTKERPAQTKTNPETGETTEVPAKTLVAFRPRKKKAEQAAEG